MSTAVAAVPRTPPAAIEALLHRVRRAWRLGVLLRALLLAVALGGAAALLLIAIDLAAPLPDGWRRGLRWLPLLVAAAVLARGAFRVWATGELHRFALLAEERLPGLENRLVTTLSAAPVDGPVARAFRAEAEGRIARADPRAAAPLALGIPAAALLAVALLGFGGAVLFPAAAREAWKRWSAPERAYPSAWREVRASTLPTVPTSAAVPRVPGFDELRWRITPPAYTGLPEREVRGGELPPVLPGSRVVLHGRFPGAWDAVRAARIGGESLPVRRSGEEWSAAWTRSPGERGVVLEAVAGGGVVARRVVPLPPAVDRPPQLRLELPAEDLVFAAPAGRVPVRAAVRDDHGVGAFRLAWIRSRGSGETFSFTEGGAEWSSRRQVGGGTVGEATLDLAALGLEPGDVLHLRAVARDRNTVSGPGESASETRVLRIARPDELEQVNTTIGYPLEREGNPLLSQRMLILLTERLRDRAPRLGRDELLREGSEIGGQQGRLRGRVGEQIFTRSTGAMADPGAHTGFEDSEGENHAGDDHAAGVAPSAAATLEAADRATGGAGDADVAHRHDEAPIIAVDRTLVTVYNAMWAAERALNQGEPAAALPHQHTALRLLKGMQAGERVFARGRVRTDPVDVRGARGTGKLDEAAPAPRSAERAPAHEVPALAELDAAVAALAEGDAAAALSSLAARLLADPDAPPRAGALVARAADAARKGRSGEARRLAASARRALDGEGRGGSAPPLPSPADPVAAEYFRRLGGGGG